MNTIDELIKSLGLDELNTDAEDATTSESTIANTSDGKSYIKGENESAEDFVQRLPPSKILLPEQADYIAVNSIRNVEGLERFLAKSEKILKLYKKKYVDNNKDPHPLLGNVLLEKLTLLAQDENFLESRYKLVPPPGVVDDVWLDIVRCTMAGELGINAKINRKTSNYEIRVYMKDFTDDLDEMRVYRCLYNLKLVDYQMEYKGSFLSKLGIGEGNMFYMAPKLYLRTDIFLMRDDDMGPLLGVKDENESAESFATRLLPSTVLYPNNGYLTIFPDEDGDPRCRVKVVGALLLEAYKFQIIMSSVSKRNSFTHEIQNKLKQLAMECNYVKGRWIVNATENVDLFWLKTVKATINGTLGINASIKKFKQNYEIRVITKDFNDEADVMRVLTEMKKIGFKPPYFYKTHVYSKLCISKNNDFGLNPYLYEELNDGPIRSYGSVME